MPPLVPSRQFQNQSPLALGVNRLNQPLYDRVNVATTLPTGNIPFFSVPAGASATIIRGSTATSYTKTRRDTNMDIGGQSPQKAFLIVGMSIDYIPLSPAAATATGAFVTQDIMTLKNGLRFEFKVVDTLVFEGPNKWVPASDPFTATTLNASLASGSSSQGGVPMLKFPESIYLPPTTNITANMYFDGPTSAIALNQTFDILWTFWALLERNG